MPPKEKKKTKKEIEDEEAAAEAARLEAELHADDPPVRDSFNLAFVDIGPKSAVEFREKQSAEDILEWITKKFEISDYKDNARNMILADCYLECTLFARNLGFDDEKITAFLAIIRRSMEGLMREKLGATECYDMFKDLLLRHSYHSPPNASLVFKEEDIMAITGFVMNGIFKHFRLYRYVANTDQECDTFEKKLFVHTAQPCPPLEMGMDPNLISSVKLEENRAATPLQTQGGRDDFLRPDSRPGSAAGMKKGASGSNFPVPTDQHTADPLSVEETQEQMLERTVGKVLETQMSRISAEMNSKWDVKMKQLIHKVERLEKT